MNQKPTFNPLADPDLADAILLAMLDNPHHADAIATLSDEDLARIAAETPLDPHDETPATYEPHPSSPWHVGHVEPDRQYDSGIVRR